MSAPYCCQILQLASELKMKMFSQERKFASSPYQGENVDMDGYYPIYEITPYLLEPKKPFQTGCMYTVESFLTCAKSV